MVVISYEKARVRFAVENKKPSQKEERIQSEETISKIPDSQTMNSKKEQQGPRVDQDEDRENSHENSMKDETRVENTNKAVPSKEFASTLKKKLEEQCRCSCTSQPPH